MKATMLLHRTVLFLRFLYQASMSSPLPGYDDTQVNPTDFLHDVAPLSYDHNLPIYPSDDLLNFYPEDVNPAEDQGPAYDYRLPVYPSDYKELFVPSNNPSYGYSPALYPSEDYNQYNQQNPLDDQLQPTLLNRVKGDSNSDAQTLTVEVNKKKPKGIKEYFTPVNVAQKRNRANISPELQQHTKKGKGDKSSAAEKMSVASMEAISKLLDDKLAVLATKADMQVLENMIKAVSEENKVLKQELTQYKKLFKKFMKVFNKNYDKAEFKKRFKIFKSNCKKLTTSAMRKSLDKPTVTMKLDYFMDMTDKEKLLVRK